MGFSLSGGPYQFNRFDEYEARLEEGKGASDPKKMQKAVKKAAAKNKKSSAAYKEVDEKEEEDQEVETAGGGEAMGEGYKGKHGQSDSEYMDSRSDAGKMISGDSKMSGASYTHGRRVGKSGPNKPGGRPQNQGKMDDWGRNDLAIRKKQLKKEEYIDENRRAARSAGGYKDDSKKQTDPSKDGFTGIGNSIKEIMKQNAEIKARGGPPGKPVKEDYIEEKDGDLAQRKLNKADNATKEKLQAKIMEQEQRMAMYSRALGIMGAHYSGPGFGVPSLEEKKELPDFLKKKGDDDDDDDKKKSKGKKADKDYDGDGEVESSEKEHAGSVHNAIQRAKGGKADGKDTRKEEYVQEYAQMAAMAGKALASGAAKGAAKQAGKAALSSAATTAGNRAGSAIGNIGSKNSSGMDEEVSITKDMVLGFLLDENYANNVVSAEALFNHMSDDFLLEIEGRIEEVIFEGDADQGVSGDEAMERHGIKKHEGPMKVTKLKAKKGPKGSALKPTRYKGKGNNVRDRANNDLQ